MGQSTPNSGNSTRAEYVWARMSMLFGPTWTSFYGDDPRGAGAVEWRAALADLSRAQIDTGVDACRREAGQFPPNVGRFRMLALGIPTFDRVRYESALTADRRSEFTRAVWRYLDVYSYRNSSITAADKLLQSAYNLALEDAMRGELKPPPEPEPEKTPEPPVVTRTFGGPKPAEFFTDVSPQGRENRMVHLRNLFDTLEKEHPDMAEYFRPKDRQQRG